MKNCIVAQSGGPTSVINASLSGVISKALDAEQIGTVYGGVNGIQGVLEDNLMNLTERFGEKREDLETLNNTPAMFLGSCRYKLKKEEYDKIFATFEKYNVGYFFYIGGNDSMDTVMQLSNYAIEKGIDVKIMGVPKTVDNDLVGTDHTPGFASAAKFVATTILEVAHDVYIYQPKSVTIFEIMGRDAGWLTAASMLARNEYSSAPDLIYLPEVAFHIDEFVTKIKELLEEKDNLVIAVSEGIKDATGEYVSASSAAVDSFGHKQLSGTGKTLENIVKEQVGCKCRSIELSVVQRAAAHIASQTDITEANQVGRKAVEAAVNGTTGYMATIERVSSNPYKVEFGTVDIKKVANQEKIVPREWVNEEGNNLNEKALEYFAPLIEGEPKITYKNGVPVYLDVSHLRKK